MPENGTCAPRCLPSQVFQPAFPVLLVAPFRCPSGASDLSEETNLILSAPLLCLSGDAHRPGVVDKSGPPEPPTTALLPDSGHSSSASLSAPAPQPPWNLSTPIRTFTSAGHGKLLQPLITAGCTVSAETQRAPLIPRTSPAFLCMSPTPSTWVRV